MIRGGLMAEKRKDGGRVLFQITCNMIFLSLIGSLTKKLRPKVKDRKIEK